MPLRARSAPAIVVLVVALGAAACGSVDGPAAADDRTEVVTEVRTETVVVTEEATVVETELVTPDDDDGEGEAGADEPAAGADGPAAGPQPFPADTSRDSAAADGDQIRLVDVRIGRHDGYDRVTFEFTGDGEPGWSIEYVTEPRLQGSGQSVDIAGDAVLGGLISGVAIPRGGGYDGPERLDGDRLTVVSEVVLGVTFEGNLGAFVGVDERVPFRVRRFASPPRVVVDVVHPDRAA